MRQKRSRLDKTKSALKKCIEASIRHELPKQEVCVLLSGGADSTTVALAAHHLEKRITAISYQVEDITSWDCDHAEQTARTFGWDFKKVVIKNEGIKSVFLELVTIHQCQTKTQVECLLPFKAMLDVAIALGFDRILTGFNNPIPDDRRDTISCSRDTTAFWEHKRRNPNVPDSPATKRMIEFAQGKGIKVVTPLGSPKIIDLLDGLTVREMNKPYEKHHWKDLYHDDFKRVGLLQSRNTPGLQTGGGIEALLAPLLKDRTINFSEYHLGSTKVQLSSVCRAWARRVSDLASQAANHRAPSPVKDTHVSFTPYTLQDVIESSKRNLFTVVSLFAGGGGSSTGYRLAGGRIIFVNEFIKTAAETYNLNYPDTPVIEKDIRKLTKGREYLEAIFAQYGVEREQLDILDGSPPCSTFSTAGKGTSKIKAMRVVYSETTQNRVGMLIHDFIFMANAMRPKVCIIENVPSIKSSEVFKHACERLTRGGYLVNSKVLESSDFGISQRRRRLFALAIRDDVARKLKLKDDHDILSMFPDYSSRQPSIREALTGLTIDPQERDFLLIGARKIASYELIKQIPFDPPKPMKLSDVTGNWKSDFNLVRTSWDQPSPTITATGAQIGRSGLYHPSENRIFTIAELKRLMGLPDDFRLTGSFNQKAERIGRMVPPLMTRALAAAVYEKVLSKL